jgi:hypothetical protein
MAVRYLCQWISQILLVQDLFGMGKPDIEIWSVPQGVKWTQPVPSGCVGDLCEYSPSPGGKDSEAETDRILKSFWNNEKIEILAMKIGAPVFGWGQDRRLICSWRVYFKATSPWWSVITQDPLFKQFSSHPFIPCVFSFENSSTPVSSLSSF